MWWKKKSKPAPEQNIPDVSDDDRPWGLGRIAEMTVDEQILAAENVMTCRDFLNLFMQIIAQHRLDDHECLPYCMPIELHHHMNALDLAETRLVLIVALKDMFDVYHRFSAEQT